MFPIKTILHPTDFSERSDHAFRMACIMARDHGGRVVVMHVAVPPTPIGFEGGFLPEPPIDEVALRQNLAAFRSHFPDVAVETRLVVGADPVDEILRMSAEIKCDLIVMGSHGRTGLQRALLGSVAELVLRRAECPVLTVKKPFAKKSEFEEATCKTQSDPLTIF